MKKKDNNSRRNFLLQAGQLLACASAAALVSPASLLAQPVAPNDLGKKAQGKIKFSMYLYTLQDCPTPREKLDIVEICRKTRELGIDGFDFIGNGYNKSWAEIRKITDDFGLKTICYSAGVNKFLSPDLATRKSGLDDFQEILDIAHTLGSGRIMMPQSGSNTGNDSATNRKWMIEGLKDALPIAKSQGIEVTIETHSHVTAPFKCSSDFLEAIAIVPDLRVCFDSGNDFMHGEDPLKGYLDNKDYVTHVHFKDFASGVPGKPGPLAIPGTGVIDLRSILEAMKKQGYNGYINLERGSKDGWEVYREGMKKLGPYIA